MITTFIWIAYGVFVVWLLYGVFKSQIRPFIGRKDNQTTPEENEGAGYGCEIGAIFRVLAADLKRDGELTLCADALFIADKADGYGWRGADALEYSEGGGVSLYDAALLLNKIAEQTGKTEGVQRAARMLYELNEGTGD